MNKPLRKPTKASSTNNPPHNRVGLRLGSAIPFLLFFIVVVFILYPVVMIGINSFTEDGHFSFASYRQAFTSPTTYKALLNTLEMVLGVLLLTWLIGGSLAFVRQKTDFKYKSLLDTLVFLSFTIPSYILSISWIEVMSRGGYLHRLLRLIYPPIRYGIQAYSIEATAIVLALHLYPLVYYGISNALKIMDSPMEQCARVCGAKRWRIIFTVILPLIVPSFLSTGLLVVSRSMANFGVTAQLALPVGKQVLTTRIFSAMTDLNLPLVSVLSLILVALSFGLFRLSERVINNKRYAMVASTGISTKMKFKLGKGRGLVGGLIAVFFTVTIALPMVTIALSSFLKRWGLPLKQGNMTLNNYAQLFSGNNILTQPLINSLCYGISAAAVAAVVASLIVYYDRFKHARWTKWLLNLAQLPIAFPNMILAVGAMFAWIHEPFKLYGTGAIIMVTYTVLFIPICIKQMLGASKNMDTSLDMAAQTMGIPLMQRFTKLFIPQIKESLIAGVLVCFLISLREIPISLLLYTAGTQTLGVMLFTIQSNSYGLEMTSTVAVVVIALSLTGNLILRKFGSRGYAKYE